MKMAIESPEATLMLQTLGAPAFNAHCYAVVWVRRVMCSWYIRSVCHICGLQT